MNLILARACSNSCSYCFETAERQAGKQNFLSMESAAQLANWARDSGLQYLSLAGGEPFLHPELSDIVALFRQVCPGTGLRILTGGVFKKSLLDGLSPEDVGLVFNINEPRDYRNPKHFARVMSNVETAIRKGFRVILGFNVWRLDFDASFMPNLAYRLARSSFRWTVANPQRDFPSSVVKPEQYNALAERCFAMLQKAAQLNIEALLDCPLPFCFFKDSELAWVRQYHPGTAQRLGFCEPVLDVTPELEVIRCFALSRLTRVKLMDFPNEGAIFDWFRERIDSQLLHQGCFSYCSQCPHFQTGRCYGGCLAWHKGAVDVEAQPGATRLALRMYDAIEAGRPDLALSQYESANYWSKTVASTYVAAIAASKLGKWKQMFRYAASAQDMTADSTPDLKRLVRELMTSIPPGDIRTAVRPLPKKVSLPFVSCPRQAEGEADQH